MVTGWRRAFCTSIPKEKQTKAVTDRQQCETTTNTQSPRISSKFGFFSSSSASSSNPSTPRLRCRTTTSATAPTTPNSSLPNSPKLQCNTTSTTPTKKTSFSPRLFHRSNPSSPKSPSGFSLLKSTLRLNNNKSRCGICLQSMKSGHGTAIFTAECSHSFHFPCVATHVKKQHQAMVCPVCDATWKELPLLDNIITPIPHSNNNKPTQTSSSNESSNNINKLRDVKTKPLRVYDDDEPLMSPTFAARFNPIPESDENDDEETDAVEFQGFFVNPSGGSGGGDGCKGVKSVEFSLLPESAVVAVGRSYETCAVVLKVKAPQLPEAKSNSSSRRRPAAIDLVAVVDVSAKTTGAKRALRLVISSLSDADRLSIVAFSSTSKRLLPLRRMTSAGRRSARRTVDALCGVGQGMCVNDALKKAAKVLQDRREKNPVASILLLSDCGDSDTHKRSSTSPVVSSTRLPQLDIPVHTVGLTEVTDEAFAKCVGGLLSVVVKDMKLQLSLVTGSASAEIAAVYSLTGRPTALGSSSIRLGDLYAGEERELLVELKVPATNPTAGSHSQNSMMSVRSTYRDPSSNELLCSKERALLVPRPQAVRSSNPNIQRLRNLHVTARAVAESRRFLDRNDFPGAYRLLTSARALLLQSSSASAEEFLRGLEAELAELHRGRQHHNQRLRGNGHVEEKPEPLTPTSAWRAAERLAKVAIMRKSMNRVSDLHGFENARF